MVRPNPSRELLKPVTDTSHLLITRPTESNALESFVLQRAEESPHAAMLVRYLPRLK